MVGIWFMLLWAHKKEGFYKQNWFPFGRIISGDNLFISSSIIKILFYDNCLLGTQPILQLILIQDDIYINMLHISHK